MAFRYKLSWLLANAGCQLSMPQLSLLLQFNLACYIRFQNRYDRYCVLLHDSQCVVIQGISLNLALLMKSALVTSNHEPASKCLRGLALAVGADYLLLLNNRPKALAPCAFMSLLPVLQLCMNMQCDQCSLAQKLQGIPRRLQYPTWDHSKAGLSLSTICHTTQT